MLALKSALVPCYYYTRCRPSCRPNTPRTLIVVSPCRDQLVVRKDRLEATLGINCDQVLPRLNFATQRKGPAFLCASASGTLMHCAKYGVRSKHRWFSVHIRLSCSLSCTKLYFGYCATSGSSQQQCHAVFMSSPLELAFERKQLQVRDQSPLGPCNSAPRWALI